MLSGVPVRLKPRRVRCTGCRTTHVLLPAWCLPRRGDAAEVIGAALVAKAAGHGFRAIATQFGRPAATVRAWLRRARSEHAHWLYRQGITQAARLDPEVPQHTEPAGTVLGDALTALAAAVAAWKCFKRIVWAAGERVLSAAGDVVVVAVAVSPVIV
ncbi:MAG: hypothetical protein ACRDSZ_17360 [Pseudonocardiaceae bacterium]